MKSIIRKFKLIFFVLIYAFFSNSLLAIDPVVIGTKYQNDIEVNLSIIENLNKNRNQVEIKIKKDAWHADILCFLIISFGIVISIISI